MVEGVLLVWEWQGMGGVSRLRERRGQFKNKQTMYYKKVKHRIWSRIYMYRSNVTKELSMYLDTNSTCD